MSEVALMPFGGDQERLHLATDRARLRQAAAQRAVETGACFGREDVQAAVAELGQLHERTAFGWVRWSAPTTDDGVGVMPAQLGLFAPGWQRGWRRAVLRAVWERAPQQPVAVRCCGGITPGPLLWGLVVFVAGVLLLGPHLRGQVSLTVPAILALLAAGGLPAAARRVTQRWVRIVPVAQGAARWVYRVAGAQQALEASAAVCGARVREVADAAGLAPELMWEAAAAAREVEEGDLAAAPALEDVVALAEEMAQRAVEASVEERRLAREIGTGVEVVDAVPAEPRRPLVWARLQAAEHARLLREAAESVAAARRSVAAATEQP